MLEAIKELHMEGIQSDPSSHAPDTRDDRIKKQETLNEISNLELRIVTIERERSSQLFSRKQEFHCNFSTLEETETKLHQQRKSEKQDLRQQVQKINGSVKGFRRLLADMKPGAGFVEKLRIAMEEIEAAIISFKEKQREFYESLLQDERALSQEVTAFEKKLETWLADQPKPTHVPVSAATLHTRAPSMPPAVVAFERFLVQTGGRQGGWDDFDHQIFLKVRNAHNANPSFIEQAASELPTKTIDDIGKHNQWYTEYCTLVERKKLAIEEWKLEKKAHKSTTIHQEPDNVEKNQKKKDEIIKREKEERFAKLSAWKAQQELKQLELKEQQLKSEQDKRREFEREQKRRAMLKSSVQEYVRQRDEENKVQKELEEIKKAEESQQRRFATIEVRRFRERDLKVTSEKKQRILEENAQKVEQQKKLDRLKKKVEVNVLRDSSRLYKETAGWVERKKAGFGSGMGGATVVMPRRAVPSWRQGL